MAYRRDNSLATVEGQGPGEMIPRFHSDLSGDFTNAKCISCNDRLGGRNTCNPCETIVDLAYVLPAPVDAINDLASNTRAPAPATAPLLAFAFLGMGPLRRDCRARNPHISPASPGGASDQPDLGSNSDSRRTSA